VVDDLRGATPVAGTADAKLRLAVNFFFLDGLPRLSGGAFSYSISWDRVYRMFCTLGCDYNAPLLGSLRWRDE
jgi:hypothetical protein